MVKLTTLIVFCTTEDLYLPELMPELRWPQAYLPACNNIIYHLLVHYQIPKHVLLNMCGKNTSCKLDYCNTLILKLGV
jgi:hypothetical protein